MEDLKYEEAKTILEEISSYSDASGKLDECNYNIATELYDNGDYEEARAIFSSLSTYYNSQTMVKECDYCIAEELLDNDSYIEAMKAFHDLGTFKDSSSKFTQAENYILTENRTYSYFKDDYSMPGRWEDSSGNYVEYTRTSSGGMNAAWNISSSSGEYFKISYGIHYHGDDSTGWEKQWIFQRITSTSVNVYNYISGQTYQFTKS